MDFAGKTCVVTGGANGIGRCLVESFSKAGADVAFIDPDAEAGRALAARIGSKALFVEGDLTHEDVVSGFAARLVARFEQIDCLINNACVSRKGLLSGCGYADFSYVLALGVTAPYMLTSLLLSAFAPGAAVVNIASTRAFMSQADTESYAAAKGGISALTHALSQSLAGRVRVNAVSPGWIETGPWQHKARAAHHSPADQLQHPVGRVGRPEDVAAMVMFLCGPDAGFITGQNIIVDGGMSRKMIYHQDEGWAFSPPAED